MLNKQTNINNIYTHMYVRTRYSSVCQFIYP